MTQLPRPDPQLKDMLRRLRARPVSSWDVGERRPAMREALQRLADLSADASGGPRREVPDLGVMALPDQLAVLVTDAESARVPDAVLGELLSGLAEALSVRAG